jgi:hypothetical protein
MREKGCKGSRPFSEHAESSRPVGRGGDAGAQTRGDASRGDGAGRPGSQARGDCPRVGADFPRHRRPPQTPALGASMHLPGLPPRGRLWRCLGRRSTYRC